MIGSLLKTLLSDPNQSREKKNEVCELIANDSQKFSGLFHQAQNNLQVVCDYPFFEDKPSFRNTLLSSIEALKESRPRNYTETKWFDVLEPMSVNEYYDYHEEVLKKIHHTVVKVCQDLKPLSLQMSMLNPDIDRLLTTIIYDLLTPLMLTPQEIRSELQMRRPEIGDYWIWTQDWTDCKNEIYTLWEFTHTRIEKIGRAY